MSATTPSSSFPLGCALTLLFIAASSLPATVEATRKEIPGPPGSKAFGSRVAVLSSGRFVVVDPKFGTPDVGAVHLLSPSGEILSTLTGSHSGDLSDATVTVLKSGDFVVSSPSWDNGTVADAGALTWVSGNSGLQGEITPQNSLVGTRTNDLKIDSGLTRVVALGNGGYIALFQYFTHESAGQVTPNAGAIVLGRAGSGIVGSISPQRALIGTTQNDMVQGQLHELANGHYVATLPRWDRATETDAGAVVWLGQSTPTVGYISESNALVGTSAQDSIGHHGIFALSNGNYLVASPNWHQSAMLFPGAVTWRDGSRSHPGTISPANSLLGGQNSDLYDMRFAETATGDALVLSPGWNDPASALEDVGAVSGMSGRQPTAGVITSATAFTGTLAGDKVGFVATVLEDRSVVVSSPFASLGKGAVTLFQGAFNRAGQRLSSSNSLMGGFEGDNFGAFVTPLKSGKFAVSCPFCDTAGAIDGGLVRFVGAAADATGTVSASDSLIGRRSNDRVGTAVTPLANGNYVVTSIHVNIDGTPQAGAATWVNGSNGHPWGESSRADAVGSANSIVGTTAGDAVGNATALSNGNYVVVSMRFDAGGQADVGAITLGRGDTGTVARVSGANSIVGARAGDKLGSDLNGNLGYALALSHGRYLVGSPFFDLVSGQVAFLDAGAVTLGDGSTDITGGPNAVNSYLPLGNTGLWTGGNVQRLPNGDAVIVNERLDTFVNNVRVDDAGAITFIARGSRPGIIDFTNSVFGTTPDEGFTLHYAFNAATGELIVGRPAANEVVLFEPIKVFRDDFEER